MMQQGLCLHTLGLCSEKTSRQAWRSSRFYGEACHILSHKHTLGEKAMNVCLWLIFREWVVDNYQHNNETPLMIKLKTHYCHLLRSQNLWAGFPLRWGTLLRVRCAEMSLTRCLFSGRFQASPAHTSHQRSTKWAPLSQGFSIPALHHLKVLLKACPSTTVPKIFELFSIMPNEWLCRQDSMTFTNFIRWPIPRSAPTWVSNTEGVSIYTSSPLGSLLWCKSGLGAVCQ